MKTNLLTIVFLSLTSVVFAQTDPIPYEWFEEQSKIISDLQYKANGKDIDFGDNKIVTANYIKDNFSINYSDKLASASVNFSANGNEGLIVVEDIDLTRVKDLIESNGVILMFPNDELEWQLYMNEKPNVQKDKFFYFKAANEADSKKMFATFWEIINRLKVDKGLISESEVEKQWNDWQNLAIEDFYIKYPQSILAHEFNDEALKNVGSKYYFEKKYLEALPWLRRAANLENGYANYLLGFMYSKGQGVDKDEAKGFEYFLKGAEQGDVNAMFRAGHSYRFGWGTSGNIVSAREWYQKAANAGNVEALLEMGDSYYSGSNPGEIIEWFEKFLNKEGKLNERQMEELGLSYYYNKQYQKSLEWLIKACNEGQRNREVGLFIRAIYSKGLGGVAKDRKAGRYYWDKCY